MSLEHAPVDTASAWVSRFAPLVAPGGLVLDMACGGGRHARHFAALGYSVDAVDRDAMVISNLAQANASIAALVADLEDSPWPYEGRRFAGIVVTNYLHRPLFPLLCESLAPGGVLIYETFMLGNERFGRPSNPDFLLRPGELLVAFGATLSVVAFEQGEVMLPKPAVVQRICAVKTDDTADTTYTTRLRLP